MKKLLVSMIAALALASIAAPVQAVAAAAAQSNPAARPARDSFGCDGPLRHAIRGALQRWQAFREETPLTEEQRTRIREIVKPHRGEIRTIIAGMRKAQTQLRKAATDDEVQAAAGKVGEAARNGALLRARLAREIRPVLTSEQRQRLDSALDEFQAETGKLSALP